MAQNGFEPVAMDTSDPQTTTAPTAMAPEAPIPAPAIPHISESPIDNPPPSAAPFTVPQAPAPIAPTTQVPRTATPNRALNGTTEPPFILPPKAAPHGAPARRYLNEKVTGVLLEGMKRLATEQPDMPLKVLGEFLLQKSNELENRAPVA